MIGLNLIAIEICVKVAIKFKMCKKMFLGVLAELIRFEKSCFDLKILVLF